MRPRTLTIASFFSVAMAATLLGALSPRRSAGPRPPRPARPPPRPRSARGPAIAGLETFRDIARAVNPGVVNINTSKTVQRPRDPFHDFFGDDMMERFFGRRRPRDDRGRERRQTQTSLGSGFVIDKDGYILTNRHVIEGADEIQVTFPDGKSYEAKIVGQDARTDVGAPEDRARASPLTALALGDSDKTEVGEWVMAVGNPFGLGRQQRHGRRRVLQGTRPAARRARARRVEMIQTDAAINPGNSGRAAAQHPRRGDRHQHDDRHRRRAGQRRRRASRCRSTWRRRSCPSCARRGRSSGAGWASTIQADDRGPGRDLRPRRRPRARWSAR